MVGEALRLLRETFELRLALQHQRGIAMCLELCGAVAVALGRDEQGARAYGAADQLRRTITSPRSSDPADEAEHRHYVALGTARIGPDAWATAWAAGAALSLEEAIAEGLALAAGDEG